jgi:hypothetical protein
MDMIKKYPLIIISPKREKLKSIKTNIPVPISPVGYTKILFCFAYRTLIIFIPTAKISRNINESE